METASNASMFYTKKELALKESVGRKKGKKVFYLEADEWNDYGYETLFELYWIDEDNKSHDIGPVKIAHKSEKITRDLLRNSFSHLEENFCSLGIDDSYYININKNKAYDVLTSLNDIILNKETDYVSSSEFYQNSFMRKYEFDEEGGKKYITTVSNIVDKGLAEAGLFHLDYVFNSESEDREENEYLTRKIVFEADSKIFPPENIYVLIGENGVGKTTFLKGIAEKYSGINEDVNHIIYISTNGLDADVKQTGSMDVFSSDALKKLLSDISRSNKFSKKLMNSLGKIAQNVKFYGLDFIPRIDFYLEKNNSNEFRKWIADGSNIDRCSAGQKEVLFVFAFMIYKFNTSRSLLVIDEPENYLHAPLLSAYINEIRSFLSNERTGAMAIFATHSPVVLREIPRKCVYVLRSRDGLRYVSHPNIETFGENLGVLLNEVFGVNADKSGYFSFLKDTVKKIPKEKVEEKYNKPFSKESLSSYCMDEFGEKLGMEARALLPYIVGEAWSEIGSGKNEEH